MAVEYYSVRRLVLEPDAEHYSVFKGSTLIATEHYHNIFFRLLSKTSGGVKITLLRLTLSGVVYII